MDAIASTTRRPGLRGPNVRSGLRGPNVRSGLRGPNVRSGLRGLNAKSGLRGPKVGGGSTIRRTGVAIGVAALGLTAACSSGTASTATSTVAAARTGTTVGATTVSVAIKEGELKPSATTAPAGAVTFTVENTGTESHELLMLKTALDPAKLPLGDEGSVDEGAAGVELVDEVEDVKPGQTKSFTVDAAAGNYVILCNTVENGVVHYAHQEYSPFTVT